MPLVAAVDAQKLVLGAVLVTVDDDCGTLSTGVGEHSVGGPAGAVAAPKNLAIVLTSNKQWADANTAVDTAL